jgi:hypothetical protein
VWDDEAVRTDLARRGTGRLARYSPQHYDAQLADIITEANRRVADQRLGGDRMRRRHPHAKDRAKVSL